MVGLMSHSRGKREGGWLRHKLRILADTEEKKTGVWIQKEGKRQLKDYNREDRRERRR